MARLEVDDVAEQDLSFVELVAPDDDRLERQWALAQAGDHCLATGLDALGDRDLALARKQVHRAHLAQIHAHRVIGTLRGGLGVGLGRQLRLRRNQLVLAFRLILRLLRRALLLCFSLLVSTTLTPISLNMVSRSSICSELTSSEGSTALICSWVM